MSVFVSPSFPASLNRSLFSPHKLFNASFICSITHQTAKQSCWFLYEQASEISSEQNAMFSNACKFTSSTADYTISCKIYSITGNVLIAEVASWIMKNLPAEVVQWAWWNAKQCEINWWLYMRWLIVTCKTHSDWLMHDLTAQFTFILEFALTSVPINANACKCIHLHS